MTDVPSILIMVDSLIAGGMERQVIELLKGLKQNGNFRVVFGVLHRGGQLEAQAFAHVDTVLPLRRWVRFDVSLPAALIAQATMHKVKLIHAYGGMSSLAGLLACKFLRIPLITSIRNAPMRLSFRQQITAWCGRHSDAVVSNAHAGLVSYGLQNHPCARVIPNGVDLCRFEEVVLDRRNAHQQAICMVANFSVLKDHVTVIQAMRILHQEFPSLKLVLVGRDRGTLADSQRLVNKLGLDGVTKFVTDTNYPQPYIAASDVCVLATNVMLHGEGISNAILEYMALAKPVVATDCGGNKEVVQEGVTGYLVRAHAPEALAERINELLQIPQRATEMGQLGRERVRREFSLERMVSEHESLYASLLKEVGR